LHFELSLLHRACDKTNYDQKVGKAYLDDDGDLVLSVEAFIMPGMPIGRLALKMHKVLLSIDSYFHRTLKQLTEAQGSGVGGSGNPLLRAVGWGTVSFIGRKLPYVSGSRVQLVLKMKLGRYL